MFIKRPSNTGSASAKNGESAVFLFYEN
ncbi:hypothetical protein ELI_0027 [Eubacterium callanderi]|uniref:Uncharacterized protein n=1 Tax=Eubacterium callanderi TaxID=53442 RepID=E3GH94_9FIRM|nr:hypothetical protein ELI_0027 [Eubacterium callanderi]